LKKLNLMITEIFDKEIRMADIKRSAAEDLKIAGITPPPAITESQRGIEQVLKSINEMLLEKNRRYGDSALKPLPIFDKIINNPDEDIAVKGMLIRLSDKLKRVMNSSELRKNDVADLIGYLALICVKKGWTDFKDLID
jgi:hypothetical protein